MNFIKILLIPLFLCLSGCASHAAMDKYGILFNEKLESGQYQRIETYKPFQVIRDTSLRKCQSLGYKKFIYSVPDQGFLVLMKDKPIATAFLWGRANPHLLLLKFSESETGDIRIDFVNGSENRIVQSEVDKDIQYLVKVIKPLV